MHRYTTISAVSEGEFKDRGSRFLSFAFPINTEVDIKNALQTVKEIHPKATHHCYAYRLGLDGNNFRINDDGEPSGSAGRPIIGQIDSFGITNVLVIVVRYYGGSKLGVSGLINAYKLATFDALSSATIIEEDLKSTYELSCSYEHMNEMINFVKRTGIEIRKKKFDELCVLTIVLKVADEQEVLENIKNNYRFECKIRKFV